MKPVRIRVDLPPLGGKIWLLDRKGTFILEEGPGILRTIACTHAGAGALEAFDGIPDVGGHFPGDNMEEPAPLRPGSTQAQIDEHKQRRIAYDTRNGRAIYQAPAAIMGSFMMDGGFLHGLTIRATSGHASVSTVASIVWMPVRQRAPDPAGDA